MTDRRGFVKGLAALGAAVPALGHPERSEGSGRMARGEASPRGTAIPRSARDDTPAALQDDDRAYWLGTLRRIADPVLTSVAEGRLKRAMPVERSPGGGADRDEVSHLEAVGRLLTGIAPWLELGADATPEGALRGRYADLARRGVANAVDPRSPDYLNFTRGRQPLVDAAFLAHAVLRAPRALWERLDAPARRNLVAALVSTRAIQPYPSNWLLFSAMVEAALCAVGEPWDRMRVDYALRQHQQWYKGDGVYGDGPTFHFDYYNSFVIQPMLVDVLRATAPATNEWRGMTNDVHARARRYAAIQERLISPEGTFPPVGRSLAYRFGAFHLLAQSALRRDLPEGVHPAQVRSALTAVIRRTMEAPGTFDAGGWLTIGFAGHQPRIGEEYISTGSLYLCAAGLLPLGLPATDEFWAAPARPWTARRAWAGEDVVTDHAI
jgi:hypothetical protein